MNTFTHEGWGVGALAVAALLTGCAAGTGPAPEQAVAIHFTAVHGGTPVRCGTRLAGLGSTAVAADLRDLRFYISQLTLVNERGDAVPVKLARNDWQYTQGPNAVALIDLEDATGACATPYNTAATNAVITGTVPAGRYVGLRARMGVPEALNHGPTTGSPPPLDIAAMSWSWQAGRRFAKIELNPVGGITRRVVPKGASEAVEQRSSTFNLHLGSSGCVARTDAAGVAIRDGAGNPAYTCSNPNAAAFTLPRFDPATQAVALDVEQLFKANNLSRDEDGAVGCMAGPTDPECVGIFNALQVGFGSGSDGRPIQGGAAQTVFKAVAR